MSTSQLPRLALRQTRWAVSKRAASTTSEAASSVSSAATTAKETASTAASKAQQGLSRVTSSASSAMTSAAGAAGQAASSVSGRASGVISFVQSIIPPTVYYARVTGELAKIVFHNRAMYPPNTQVLQSYWTPVQNALRNPSTLLNRTASQAGAAADKTASAAVNNPESIVARLRNLDNATLISIGVVTAEVIGFFSVGEIIGRFKLVGYRSTGAHEHHQI